MKRIGFLYEKMLDIDVIKDAFYEVKKKKSAKKRKHKDMIDYEKNIELNSYKIFMALSQNKYQFSKGHSRKVVSYDKERVITKPTIKDKVVQRLILNQVKPIIMRGMYRYSCGSIPNRGVHYAKRYTQRYIRKYKPKYCLVIDIKKYYHNIDIKVMEQLFRRKIKDEKMMSLIINLLNAGADESGKGLPIGFYSSQWFSNFYLESLDQLIKETLYVKGYVRYVDDINIFGNNKRELHKIMRIIEEYLWVTLELRVKDNWQVFRIMHRDVDFVGFKFSYRKTLVRKRQLKLFKRHAKNIESGNLNIYLCRVFMTDYSWLKHIKSSLIKKYKKIIYTAKKYISWYDKRRLKDYGNI